MDFDEVLDDFIDRRGLYLLAGLLILAMLVGYMVADLEHEIDALRREVRYALGNLYAEWGNFRAPVVEHDNGKSLDQSATEHASEPRERDTAPSKDAATDLA